MKRTAFKIGLACLLLSGVAGCRQERLAGGAAVIERDGVKILVLSGGPYEQGYGHGYRLAGQIAAGFDEMLARYVDAGQYETLIRPIIVCNAILTEPWRRELQGLHAGIVGRLGEAPRIKPLGRRMMLDDLIALNTFADWYIALGGQAEPPREAGALGCSSVAVWGSASQTGSAIVGRNLDYLATNFTLDNRMLVLRLGDSAKGTPATVTVSFPGLIGVISGLSERGLFVALHDVGDTPESVKQAKYTPRTLAARTLLEDISAEPIAEAATGLLRGKEALLGSNIVLVGSRGAVVIEWGPKGMAICRAKPGTAAIFATNHYRALARPQDCYRLKTMQAAVLGKIESNSPVGVQGIIAALSRAAVGSTLHSVIAEPARMAMTVYFSPGHDSPAITGGKPIRIDLPELLGAARAALR